MALYVLRQKMKMNKDLLIARFTGSALLLVTLFAIPSNSSLVEISTAWILISLASLCVASK